MPWSTSDRRDHLPSNWPQLRQQVKARANGVCEWRDRTGKRCTDEGRECHHTGHRDDHDLNKLMWICTPHHKLETNQQAKRKQYAMYVTARKRTPEQHPGMPSH